MITINAKTLRAAAMFAAPKEVRNRLHYVQVRAESGVLTIAGTDGCTGFVSRTATDAPDINLRVPAALAAKAKGETVTLALDRIGDTLADLSPDVHDDWRMADVLTDRVPAELVPGYTAALNARYLARVGDAFDALTKGSKYGAPVRCSVSVADSETSAHVFTSSAADGVTVLVMPMRD